MVMSNDCSRFAGAGGRSTLYGGMRLSEAATGNHARTRVTSASPCTGPVRRSTRRAETDVMVAGETDLQTPFVSAGGGGGGVRWSTTVTPGSDALQQADLKLPCRDQRLRATRRELEYVAETSY